MHRTASTDLNVMLSSLIPHTRPDNPAENTGHVQESRKAGRTRSVTDNKAERGQQEFLVDKGRSTTGGFSKQAQTPA